MEQANSKGDKKIIAKLEERIHSMQCLLENERHRGQEVEKNVRKLDSRVKELEFQVCFSMKISDKNPKKTFHVKTDERKKNEERMTDSVDKLQQKIRIYKRQIEETVFFKKFHF